MASLAVSAASEVASVAPIPILIFEQKELNIKVRLDPFSFASALAKSRSRKS